MNEIQFDGARQELNALLITEIGEIESNSTAQASLKLLLGILNQYSYVNRLKMKGLLTHTIIDSLDVDDTLAEAFIIFDKNI